MTAARTLSHHTLERIRKRFALSEVCRPDEEAYLPLSSPFGRVGELRLFRGNDASVRKMVYIGMAVAQFGLDSHMIFAFTAPGSAVPHFTLDSVMNAPDFAFHLDLIPRLDLGANVEYILSAFTPLDPIYEDASKIEGLKPARLTPTQYALMSPWMLVYRANESAFEAIQTPVSAYLDHWFSLVERGITPPAGETPESLAERDRRNRVAIFNPQIDKVWVQVERLVGSAMGETMRQILINQEVES
ncbi:MAG TPA: hypothetical protein PLD47_08590 [Aggregatilineales bacterium]|nr:hypothetical protein [Anaerolineales bacterium]HRE47769.1 hypothetical protein [Aggregatilineales bacterium]